MHTDSNYHFLGCVSHVQRLRLGAVVVGIHSLAVHRVAVHIEVGVEDIHSSAAGIKKRLMRSI